MSQTTPNVSDQTVDEAINWLIRMEISDQSEASRPEFELWLQQSSEHQLAWERVKGIHQGFKSLPPKPVTQTFEALNQHSRSSGINRRQALKMLSVAGLTLGTGWLSKEHTPWQRLISDYSTEIGQQRHLSLADDVQAILNTDSAISVDLAGNRREVKLRRGETQVTTVKGESDKPLLVKTPVGRISTLDTRFTLRLNKAHARVSVHDGQLKLLNRSGRTQRVVSGESYWFSDREILPATPSAIPIDAWVTGAISGQNIPLGELLDELSRYRLGIIDYAPEIKDHQVSGIFQLKDTDTTLNFLAQVHPLQIEFRTPYWVVVRPA